MTDRGFTTIEAMRDSAEAMLCAHRSIGNLT
jgi:hypothetical protein